MEEFYILILVAFFITNSLDTAKSVQLEELPLQTFDELFVDEWLDKDEAEDLKTPPTTSGQNAHHQSDRQNTQIGQIEPNSTDHLGQLEPNSTDHLGQLEPNSTDHLGQIEPNLTYQNPRLTESDHSGQIEPNSSDQNPPFTESDHSDNTKNGEEQNEKIAEDEQKPKIIAKFHAIKDEFKQKGKFLAKEWNQIEQKIAKHLKVNRTKIYEWKKEFGLIRKMHNFGKKKNEQKNLLEKFDQMKAELQRGGFKNSQNKLDKTVAKELGLSFGTIYNWKRELGQTKTNKYRHSKQKELMKRYYAIKDKTPKINDADIAKIFKIGRATLVRWKRQFKRQQLHPNSVDDDANVQEIDNSNSRSI